MSIKASELITALNKTVGIEGDFVIRDYKGLRKISLNTYDLIIEDFSSTSDIKVPVSGITDKKDFDLTNVKGGEEYSAGAELKPEKVIIKQPTKKKGWKR